MASDKRHEAIGDDHLQVSARFLAARGVYGLLWLDRELKVTARFGELVLNIPVGGMVSDSLVPLFGLEDEICALVTRGPDDYFDLPAVTLMLGGEMTPRLNLTVFWLTGEERFLVLVARATSRSDVDELLAQQTRLRLIAEAELTRQKKELERANADLEQYASIISHDLKAPLRGMRYLADDAEAAIGSGDQAGALRLLAELKQHSRRMSGMMTALLDYSSVGRKAEAVETVDTRALVENAVRSVRTPPGFEVVIDGRWPVMDTVVAPFELVVRNLIDNALKHHDRDAGRVVVKGALTASGLSISVSDDGPGIPVDHHDVVLRPFKRLLRTTEAGAEGHGMGLAFVRRTVELLGGTLQLQSDPEVARGTTVKVVWPNKIISL